MKNELSQKVWNQMTTDSYIQTNDATPTNVFHDLTVLLPAMKMSHK